MILLVRKTGILAGLLVLAIICLAFPVSAAVPPGGTGYLIITCPVDGATVSINGVTMGTISDGEYYTKYEESYTTYTLSKSGYYDATGEIPTLAPGGTSNVEIAVTLTEKPVGSGKGWIAVHCNVDGASVLFDGSYKGEITNGVATIEVSTSGSPVSSFTVTKNGYQSYQGTISSMPESGQTVDVYATLNLIPTTVPTTIVTTYQTPVGGDKGYYSFTCNENGAYVYLDDAYKGTITNGVLVIPVTTTATPYKSYRVSKTGYVSATGSLSGNPASGQTTQISVTLNPLPTPTPLPLGSSTGQYAIHTTPDGAEVYLDDTYMGLSNGGVLTVSVYTTGTPYQTLTVKKEGYTPSTQAITQYPGSGETVDMYVALAAATLAPTTVSTTMAPTAVPTTEQSPFPLAAVLVSLSIGMLAVALRK